jgi:hypothetical protein
VNAWNEWGEGAYLEPDMAHSHLNLQALNSALSRVRHETEPLSILGRLRRPGIYSGSDRDERQLLNLLRGHEQATRALLAALRAERAKRSGAEG